MKTIHIIGRYKKPITIPESTLANLPKSLTLFTTAQFIDQFKSIQDQLEQANIKVYLAKTRHTAFKGQIYGCSTPQINTKGEAFLYIGDGEFHPFALLINNQLPVYAFNPVINKLKQYTKKDIEKKLRRKKGAYLSFLTKTNIGVIITTKFGQNRIKLAQKLKEKFPKKKFYFFLTETLDFQELENFPYIDVFINTMCPRIGYDDTIRTPKPIINMEDVAEDLLF